MGQAGMSNQQKLPRLSILTRIKKTIQTQQLFIPVLFQQRFSAWSAIIGLTKNITALE